MKRKLSKILGIALTVAMLASLLISAAPALAISQPTVAIDTGEDEISKVNAGYTIFTKTAVYLGANSTFTITLPEGYVVDNVTAPGVTGTISAGMGWDNSNPPVQIAAVNTTAATFTGNAGARTITVKLPSNGKIGASAEVYIKVNTGIKNPANPGTYALTLKTSAETTEVTSTTVTIKEPSLGALPGVATAYNSAGIAMNQSNKIADVIGNAGEGGKVVITAGTYNENIVIAANKVTLEAASGVIIPATGSITVNGNEVTLKGFTFKSSATAASRVTITGDKAKVENCNFETILNNTAIVVAAGAAGTIITNNTIAVGAKAGVAVAGTGNAEITGNTMTVTTGGVAIAAADNVTVKTNTITGSSGTGITLTGGTATIEANTLKTLDQAISYTSAVTIKGNTIDTCGSATLPAINAAYTAGNSTITGNIIKNTHASAYAVNVAVTPNVVNAQFNQIINNTYNIKVTSGTGNFKLNWWGDASGSVASKNSVAAGCTLDVSAPLGAVPGADSTSAIAAANVNTKTTAGVDIASVTTAGVASNMKEVGISKLTANPVATTPPIMGTGSVVAYWDIYVKPANANDVLTIKLYSTAVSEYSKIYYGGGLSGLWSAVSNQGVNVAGGYVWFTTSGTTTPTTSELTGTPFALVTDKTLAAPALTVAAGATPAIGAYDISVTPTFTWGAVAGADHYQINLCEDPSFTILEWAYNVDTPFFKADEALRNETTYYWRVRGVLDAASTAFTPWATGIFTTAAEEVVAEAPITVEPVTPEVTVEIPPTKITVEPSAPAIPTYLLWIIVVVGAVLVIALIVLIVRTRRVA